MHTNTHMIFTSSVCFPFFGPVLLARPSVHTWKFALPTHAEGKLSSVQRTPAYNKTLLLHTLFFSVITFCLSFYPSPLLSFYFQNTSSALPKRGVYGKLGQKPNTTWQDNWRPRWQVIVLSTQPPFGVWSQLLEFLSSNCVWMSVYFCGWALR